MTKLSALRARTGAFLSSFFCPQQVNTSRSSGLLRIIACICMAIDHSGKMLFPDQPWMRLVGRLAFPLFAYGIAVGAVYTRNPSAYLRRLALLALISQPLYALGLAHENSAMYAVSFAARPLEAVWRFYVKSFVTPSILVSLCAGLTLLLLLRRREWIMAFFVYILLQRFGPNLDYGMFGIHLMLLFYLLCSRPLLCAAAVTAFIFKSSVGYGYVLFGHEFTMRIFALPAALLACLPTRRNFRLPQWFTYGFYPAHLAVLAILVKLF